jgi:hypothetical protein
MKKVPYRFALLLLAIAFIAAACASNAAPSTTRSASAPKPTPTTMMMHLPAYAQNMKVLITSPASGTKVTANSVTLAVQASGYTPTCALAGKADQAGSGHYHILLDKALVNMYCTPTATVSMQNVAPGMHTLTAVPTLNDHTEIEENGNSITIDYEPTHPLPTISGTTFAGAPTITILSPKNGAVVSGTFDVVVKVTNYNLSCNLMGKPDVTRNGHWHLNLDSMSGPMMGMGTMLGMSCTTTFQATTQGLKSGQTHTLIALLTDNGHAPLHPPVASEATVMIG